MSGGVAGYGAGSAGYPVELDSALEDAEAHVKRLKKKYNRCVDELVGLLSLVHQVRLEDELALVTESRNNVRELLDQVRAGEALLVELEQGEAEEAVAVAAAAEEKAAAAEEKAAAATAAALAAPDVECCVCMQDIPKADRFKVEPCEHSNICEQCAGRLMYQEVTACPMCRGYIARFVPFLPRGV